MSVFDLGSRRMSGPTRRGTGVFVRYQTLSPPARLLLPQTGQQLRWGRLEVSLVRDDRGVLRPRAVAVIPFNLYLRGLGEMPGSCAVVPQELLHRRRGRGRPGQADPGDPGGRRLGHPAPTV
jgi:hypothetical protein